MLILAVDPGLRGSGVALFDETTKALLRADYVKGSLKGERAEAWGAMRDAVWTWAEPWRVDLRLVIEFPQVRQRGSQRASKRGTDPNDLIQLAAVVGAIVSMRSLKGIVVRLPEEWKGQVPKEVHHQRAMGRLSVAELTRLPKQAKSIFHNTMDAVALGLTELGRLGKFSEPSVSTGR
jgi:hypothetical protein